jgi:hypothetical protein
VSYEVKDTGNPLVATIEPLKFKSRAQDGKFKVTGVGDGTTVLKIYWKGPRGGVTCHAKITVTAE